MIKAFIFDLDGTIVSPATGTYSPAIREAFTQLRAAGFLLFAATGRSPYEFAVTKMIDGLEFDAIICLNGQYCYNSERTIFCRPFSVSQSEAILHHAIASGYPCAVIGTGTTYISHSNTQVAAAQAYVHTPVPQQRELTNFLGQEILMFTFYVPEAEQAAFLRPLHGVTAARWHPLAFDIVPAGGGKKAGIEAVLTAYGLCWNDVMAFGDGDNDLEMLQCASRGIAMQDSSQLLLNAGFELTGPADADGVVTALQRHGFLPRAPVLERRFPNAKRDRG